jgi:outer membrane protein assembly factor BamB
LVFYSNSVINLLSGQSAGMLTSAGYPGTGAMAIDTNSIYTVYQGMISRFARSSLALDWQLSPSDAGQLGPPAITSQGDVITLGENGIIYGYRSAGTSIWSNPPHLSPVHYTPNNLTTGPMRLVLVTSTGLVLANAGDNMVHAISLSTGSEVWHSEDLGGTPHRMVVGNDGVVYVQVPLVSTVYGLAVSNGETRFVFANVPASLLTETNSLTLTHGTLYVVGNLNLMGIPVTATGLDPLAPWPSEFHDNQNTCFQGSPLTY